MSNDLKKILDGATLVEFHPENSNIFAVFDSSENEFTVYKSWSSVTGHTMFSEIDTLDSGVVNHPIPTMSEFKDRIREYFEQEY